MKNQWKKGYVSISTIVIGFAVIVLLAVCIFAFRGYIQASYMMKANKTAEKIFYAAQNYIDAEKKAGNLDAFNQQARFFGKALSMDLQERVFRENYKQDDIESRIADYWKFYKEGDVRYLVLESERVASERRADNLIFTMIGDQVPDQDIQKDSILIEYNSKTGKILTVFYSKKVDKLVYEGEDQDKKNVISRNQKLLNKKEQGYFSVKVDDIFD